MHKSTRLKNASSKTKRKVWNRDRGICVACTKKGHDIAHYIGKGQQGLGIEQNLVVLCRDCHHNYDNGKNMQKHDEIKLKIKTHLCLIYPHWDESTLKLKNKWVK